MTMNPTLAAAFANIEKWEAEQVATPVHDSSPAPEVTDAEVEAAFVDAAFDDTPSADTWTPIHAAAAPLMRHVVKVRGLDEKAVLVQVKRRMYSPYKLDEAESHAYGAGNVNKHLFEGRNNRVRQTISKFTEVYTFVNDNTVPWTTGVRLLNIDHYFAFTTGLRARIDEAEAAVADLVANWHTEVQADLARLGRIAAAKGKPNLVNPNDYPTAGEIAQRFGIEVRYMPVPTTGDFRVNISDEDKASLQKQLEDAENNAARHVVEEMIGPMRRAVEKLNVPIGQEGAIFRDSLIDNMVEVAERMERVNVCDDPVITDKIAELKSLVGSYARNKDVLRSMPDVRRKAATQIDTLVSQMAGMV
jgi:hypothetical protein